MRLLIASLAVVLMAGCASQPQPSASEPSPAASQAETKAAAAAAPAKTASTSTAKSYPGYKQKTRDGETVYCKKVARIGSNMAQETCLTGPEMEQMQAQAEQDRQQFRRNQTLCGTGGCGGG
jgi:Tfp pilus assembly protein FimV